MINYINIYTGIKSDFRCIWGDNLPIFVFNDKIEY